MNKYNVRKFLSKNRIPYKIVSSGREAVINCFFHEDNKYKLYVNLSSGLFTCFKCQEKGTLFYLITSYYSRHGKGDLNIEDLEIDNELFVPKVEPVKVADSIPFPTGYMNLSDQATRSIVGEAPYKYLAKRGVEDSLIYYYSLGIAGGVLKDRVIFPVLGNNGELLSYVARDYTDKLIPKVLTPKADGNYGIKEYVYNLNNAMKTEHIIITEGVLDAISVGSSGVALFGKSMTTSQLTKLINAAPKRITICLDADAHKDAIILYNQLTFHFEDIRLIALPAGDPNSNREFLPNILSSPLTFSQFTSKYLFGV